MAKPLSGPQEWQSHSRDRVLTSKDRTVRKSSTSAGGRILRIASLYYEKKMRDELMDEFKDCSKILHTKPSSSFIADRHSICKILSV